MKIGDFFKTKEINLGICQEVRIYPDNGWGHGDRTQVITDKGFYILDGLFSFNKNEDVIIKDFYLLKN